MIITHRSRSVPSASEQRVGLFPMLADCTYVLHAFVLGVEAGRAAQMCSVRVLGVEKLEGKRRCAVYVC